MDNKKVCIFNWSGGKDSTLALHYALKDPKIEIRWLVTTITEPYNRVSMHGVRESLLIKQAECIGIPLYLIRLPEMPDMETYDRAMHHHLTAFSAQGITHAIFGDIFLEDLKNYRENQLKAVGLQAIFPLWGKNTTGLIHEFLNLNYKTIIVCARENLAQLCGKVIDHNFISQLPAGIDPCGENGEFHTFAFEGPVFKYKIDFELGDQVFRTYNDPVQDHNEAAEEVQEKEKPGFWYIDLVG